VNSEERRQVRYKNRVEKRGGKRRAAVQKYDDFSRLIDPDNLMQAFHKARLNVSWKESVQRYEAHWLLNINNTYKKLVAGEDISNGFMEFDIHERGKSRHIKSVHISERVVQKALCDKILVPILSRPLIYDNAASLKTKGVHFSLKRLKKHLSRFYRSNGFSNEGYVLTIDLSKYFDSIRHDVLMEDVKQYVHDPKVIDLIVSFISVFGDNVSLGLGSQVSQILAVFAPNKIDHLIKEKLGIKFYGRYMDDMYLIHKDKSYLKKCLKEIGDRFSAIGLKINKKKTKISTLSHGLVFLKGRYSLCQSGKILCLPCRASTVRMSRKLRKLKAAMKHRNSRMTYQDVYDSYCSWRNTFRRRFDAYFRIRKMDGLYNHLFIKDHL
jgi:hypothetical protein